MKRVVNRLTISAMVLPFGLVMGCRDARHEWPTSARAVSEDVTGAELHAYGRPRAVFRTTPVDQDGTIVGGSPLPVEFNLCQSRPESEDDDLKFTYDFDGDGTVDSFGHCRASHVYENGGSGRSCVPASVCVSDRRPGGEVCHAYDVCIDGGERARTPGRFALPLQVVSVPPEIDGFVVGDRFSVQAALSESVVDTAPSIGAGHFPALVTALNVGFDSANAGAWKPTGSFDVAGGNYVTNAYGDNVTFEIRGAGFPEGGPGLPFSHVEFRFLTPVTDSGLGDTFGAQLGEVSYEAIFYRCWIYFELPSGDVVAVELASL
jgi:hypothetical protein